MASNTLYKGQSFDNNNINNNTPYKGQSFVDNNNNNTPYRGQSFGVDNNNNNNLLDHYLDIYVEHISKMVRTLKVSVERKTFLVRWESEHGGNWCSITEHNRGYVYALGFEKEEVGWLIELLTKAIELKSHLGFNRKYRGKSCVHLMEVCFNNHGRFIRIS